MNQIPAIPKYLGQDFPQAPPGHLFTLYFPYWMPDTFRRAGDEAGNQALKRISRLSNCAKELQEELAKRQHLNADRLGRSRMLSLIARSSSSFVTGVGVEHPVETGFSFLSPYGLPYLPGASVKGVLRRAAEELALAPKGAREGWDLLAVWLLFGFDPSTPCLTAPAQEADNLLRDKILALRNAYLGWVDAAEGDQAVLRFFVETASRAVGKQTPSDPWGLLRSLQASDENITKSAIDKLRLRGTLRFWDVMVDVEDGMLSVDITNPHYQHYYQDKKPPHDAGKLNPVKFLVVPPHSKFRFHVEYLGGLPAPLNERWRDLLESAFQYAFEWLGFGAKTAVGYGAMRRDQIAEESHAQRQRKHKLAEREKQRQELRLAKMDPIERQIQDVIENRQDTNVPKSTAVYQALQADRWTGPDRVEIATRLKKLMQDEGVWKETSAKPHKDKRYKRSRAVMKWIQVDE